MADVGEKNVYHDQHQSIDHEKAAYADKQQHLDHENVDENAQFGGLEARKKLEKRFLLKLDARMSIMIVIYILSAFSTLFEHRKPDRLIPLQTM